MPRAKIQMRLIGNARARARTFAQRKEGLMKKAGELATLCDVGVAVVCSVPGPGGGAPCVWESKEGVIRRYRALPPEKRGGQHTHLNYAKAELGKEKARLAKTRQAGPLALAQHGSVALDGMTLESLEELLGSIDAALVATAERRKALGLPDVDHDAAEEGGQLGQGAPCVGEGFEFEGMDGWDDDLMWEDGAQAPMPTVMQPAPGVHCYINGGNVDMGSINQNQQLQTVPGNGNINSNNLSQFAWDAYQPNATVHPGGGHGYHFTDSNNYVDVNYGSQMQMVPGSVDAPQHNEWLSLGMWRGDAQSSSHAFAPDSSAHFSTEHCAPGIVGDNFTGAPPSVGMGGNDFMDQNFVSEDTPQCFFADDLQYPYTSQDFGLNYLSDLADGVHF